MENIRESVVSSLYSEEGAELLDFSVKVMGNVEVGELPKETIISIRALTPEMAKASALQVAAKQGYKTVTAVDVNLVPDSDWYGKNNMGSGKDFNLNPNVFAGKVGLDAVSHAAAASAQAT